MIMEIRSRHRDKDSVLSLLKDYSKVEACEIVDGLFKAQSDGGKKRSFLEEVEEAAAEPPHKKTLLPQNLLDSLQTHLHSFVETRPPPRIKILSVEEVVANRPNPNQKPNLRNKKNPKPGSHPCRNRPPFSSAGNFKNKRKPSPNPPAAARRISPVIHEVAVSKPKSEQSSSTAKALAQLKARFGGTILKAPGQLGLASLNVAVAVAATALKRERQAARLALQRVEDAADGRDNLQIYEELKQLCDCDLDIHPKGNYPLEDFGLILKQ